MADTLVRIRHLHIDNFKSLIDFRLDLAKFTCLIGLNGAGKSTVLQCMDFLAQQVRGDIKEWLGERSWKSTNLKSRLSTKKNNIEFRIDIVDDKDHQLGCWQASFNTTKLHCTSEHLVIRGQELDVQDGSYSIYAQSPPSPIIVALPSSVHRESAPFTGWRPTNTNAKIPIAFSYQGSILSQLKDEGLPGPIVEFKRFFQSIRSLDLLSPEQLRPNTRESVGSLGLGGKRLSSFLNDLGPEKRAILKEQLKRVYEHFDDLHVRSPRSGWKQLEIQETFGTKKLTTEARQINDGMLRLMAMLAELGSDHRFLLFDEIENGINPELVEFVMNALTAARQQILVTTHSPMIINYLSDEVAKAGVMYFYKASDGSTRAIPFFSIPSLAEKLTVMGPGEAFVDTDLNRLIDEIRQQPEVL